MIHMDVYKRDRECQLCISTVNLRVFMSANFCVLVNYLAELLHFNIPNCSGN